MRNRTLLIWGRRPQTPAIFRCTARMAGGTINALERRIGLSSDGTRAPTQGPEWPGAAAVAPLKSDPLVLNLLRAKNGLDNQDHFPPPKKPCAIRIYVISVLHTWLTRSTVVPLNKYG